MLVRAACLAGAAVLLLPLTACVKKAGSPQASAAPSATEPTPEASPSTSPRSSLYAFSGEKAFGVGQAGKVLYQAASGTYGEPQWTQRGRYAAAVSRTLNVKDAKLAVIDSQTGRVISTRCGCTSVALVGDSVAVWVDERARVFQLDVTGDGVARQLTVSLPQGKPRVATAGTLDSFLLLGSDALPGDNGVGAVFSVRLDGGKTLVRDYPDINNLQFAVARSAGAGPRIAYQAIEAQGDCLHPGPIFVVDAAGTSTATDVTGLLGGRTADEADVGVLSAWWETDGTLVAVMQSWTCDPEGGKWVVEASLWRLDGNRWAQLAPAPLRITRKLTADSRLVLDGEAKLSLESPAGATPIAADVFSLVLPPAQP